MNKTLFLFSTLLFFECADAQSTFVFQNRSVSGSIDAPVFDSLGFPLSGGSFLAELYGSAASNSLAPTTTLELQLRITLPFATGAYAGYFAPNNAVMTVWDTVPGGSAWLQVRAWDARLGVTYEDVVALGIGGFGESPLFYADGGDPTGLEAPGPLFGLESFNLRPIIPEPSASALLAVGGVAWWIVRRQRGPFGRGDVL